jgi:tetratricopeptide (TPR) repeat protein
MLVAHYRDAARQDRAQLSNLAGALQDLADVLDGNNQTAEALKLVQEAVAIRRGLFKTDPSQGLVLAGSLSQQANWLATAGRRPEAEPVFAEEAATYRALIDRIPAAGLTELSMAFMQIAQMNDSVGRPRSAEGASRAGVELARRAPAGSPWGLYLSAILSMLADSLCHQKRLEEALAAAQEAVSLIQTPVVQREDSGTVRAMAYGSLGRIYRGLGRPREAEAAEAEQRRASRP